MKLASKIVLIFGGLALACFVAVCILNYVWDMPRLGHNPNEWVAELLARVAVCSATVVCFAKFSGKAEWEGQVIKVFLDKAWLSAAVLSWCFLVVMMILAIIDVVPTLGRMYCTPEETRFWWRFVVPSMNIGVELAVVALFIRLVRK